MVELLERLCGLVLPLAAAAFGLMMVAALAMEIAASPPAVLALALLAGTSIVCKIRGAIRCRTEKKAREALEREELARLEWERSPEGQAYLEERRREDAIEQERIEAERRVRRSEEERRLREAEELAALSEWRIFFESRTMLDIASMTGLEFERFLARLLPRLGYVEIALTPVNDQGGDITCTSAVGVRTVVQAKRWTGSLGNAVVQEILGAMLHYDCSAGIIITNSVFTKAARTLANKDPRILLCDGSWLAEQIKQHLPSEVPPFDWSRYNSEVVPARYKTSSGRAKIASIRDDQARRAEDALLTRIAAGEIDIDEARKQLSNMQSSPTVAPRRQRRHRRRRFR